ncbi:MAG: pyridoxal phosphate-dependent aminotransferase [Candidatus Villigracilaceae bacterium]
MFHSRVSHLQFEGAYAVLARAQVLEAQGRQVLHLEIGQPDYPTPDHIARAGIEAIEEGQTRYVSPTGIASLRAAVAQEVSRRLGLDLGPDQVVIGPGAKPGLFYATLALVGPGDEVIYPDPGFPSYAATIRIAGAIPVPVRLREEKGFSFDLDEFDARISERTKLIILNSPGNPTGSIMPLEDLQHIAKKAQEHNLWIISDEIYSQLVYDGLNVPSIAALPGMLERTVIVDGFSKTYAMTGWRLGYMVAPQALAERVGLLLTHSIGCTAAFTQYAGLEALTGPQDCVREMVADYQRRRDRMVAGLNAIPGITCQKPQGAFYVFPNVTSFGLRSAEIAARLLEEAGVAVLAGSDFGAGGEGYLRLCYCTSMEVIEQALEKMEAFFRQLA